MESSEYIADNWKTVEAFFSPPENYVTGDLSEEDEMLREKLFQRCEICCARKIISSHSRTWRIVFILILRLLNIPVRFEIFTAVTMKNDVFWDFTPCGSCKNRRFRGT
jgi:hypothetical protein